MNDNKKKKMHDTYHCLLNIILKEVNLCLNNDEHYVKFLQKLIDKQNDKFKSIKYLSLYII